MTQQNQYEQSYLAVRSSTIKYDSVHHSATVPLTFSLFTSTPKSVRSRELFASFENLCTRDLLPKMNSPLLSFISSAIRIKRKGGAEDKAEEGRFSLSLPRAEREISCKARQVLGYQAASAPGPFCSLQLGKECFADKGPCVLRVCACQCMGCVLSFIWPSFCATLPFLSVGPECWV